MGCGSSKQKVVEPGPPVQSGGETAEQPKSNEVNDSAQPEFANQTSQGVETQPPTQAKRSSNPDTNEMDNNQRPMLHHPTSSQELRSRKVDLDWENSEDEEMESEYGYSEDLELPGNDYDDLPTIRRCIKHIRAAPRLNDEQSQYNVNRLVSFIENLNPNNGNYELFVTYLIKFELIQMVQEVWSNLILYDSIISSNGSNVRDMGFDLLRCLEDLCKMSPVICKMALSPKVELQRDILRYLMSEHLKHYKMTILSRRQLACSFLRILFYMLLHHPEQARADLRDRSTIHILQPFRDCNSPPVALLSFMVQSFLFTEEEDTGLNYRLQPFQNLLQAIESSLKSDSYHGSSYDLYDLLEVLNRLAVNDNSKERIVRAGGLRYYARLLKNGHTEQIQLMAVHGIWLLAFKCGYEISNTHSVMSGLKHLLTHRNEKLAHSADGALWIITQKDEEAARTWFSRKYNNNKYKSPLEDNVINVYISHDRRDSEIVEKMCQTLETTNFSVLSNDCRENVPMDTVAQAIEEASIIIICMSQNYKESPFCRTEARYINHRKKNLAPILVEERYYPDGWVDAFVGNNLCIDFTRAGFDENMDRLIRNIRNKCRNAGNNVDGVGDQRYIGRYYDSLREINRRPRYTNSVLGTRFTDDDKRPGQASNYTEPRYSQNEIKSGLNVNYTEPRYNQQERRIRNVNHEEPAGYNQLERPVRNTKFYAEPRYIQEERRIQNGDYEEPSYDQADRRVRYSHNTERVQYYSSGREDGNEEYSPYDSNNFNRSRYINRELNRQDIFSSSEHIAELPAPDAPQTKLPPVQRQTQPSRTRPVDNSRYQDPRVIW